MEFRPEFVAESILQPTRAHHYDGSSYDAAGHGHDHDQHAHYSAHHHPPPRSPLHTILLSLPETLLSELKGLSDLLLHVAFTVLLPAALYASAFVGLYLLGRSVSKIIWPPTPHEIYCEAVRLLKKDAFVESGAASDDEDGEEHTEDEDGGRGSSDRAIALRLLRTAIEKDPDLVEAYVTLATELLHGGGGSNDGGAVDECLAECLAVIKAGSERFPKEEEFDKLGEEARAVRQFGRGGTEGMGLRVRRRMVGVGAFGSSNLAGGARAR